jgi:phosphoglycolate phosphatase
MHNETKLILFDIDCTLLLTGGAGREATLHAMQEVFGTTSRIDSHTFGGKTDWQTLVEQLEEHGFDESRIGEVMHDYAAAIGRHLDAIIHRYPVRPCPGALELVRDLHERDVIALGIVTGNVFTTAPIKLRAAGFDPAWFPVGAYGNEALQRDHLPPLALERANRHYQRQIQPSQVIVVGDTTADIACARALGGVAVAVLTGFCDPQELIDAKPDFLLDDLTSFRERVLGE